jgi:two-component system cell cycle sensor histidine kinase/response regulator CckA
MSTFTTKRPLRVLIVEDREDDLLLLLEELDRSGYTVTHTRVETPTALRAALSSNEKWDLVLSDFSLPTMTAHDVLTLVNSIRPHLPCIVLSGTITEESAVHVLRAGARDFVVKERMTRLVPAIERELRESVERRRLLASEASLLESRERMQFALEAVGVGTWELHVQDGRMIWSGVMERLHGLQPGTFAGTLDALVRAIHPDDRKDVLERVTDAQRTRGDSRIEYRTEWPDGSMHWIAGIGRILSDDHGRPVKAVGVGMDVTAQKRLEEQFLQAQKMESIGNLAGGIAHDFNNLLTIISGECELVASRVGTDADAAASLDAIRSAAVSATALTRQLLTFSRRQVVMPRVLNLNTAITGFGKILRRLVEENVHLDFRLAASLPSVRADHGQIEQVLLNLVANARDAMVDGGTMTIQTAHVNVSAEDAEARPELPAGSYVELSVIDTGSGIPADVQAHLFEPFFTTKPAGRGTGLGLATVHGIVKQSGGHIFVQSEPGAGATFRIYLPVATGDTSVAAPVQATRPADLRGSETILVVEDNAALRRLAERILRSYGYRVLVAASGEQAQQICVEHSGPISVVLTDVVMPDQSGPTIAGWICRHFPDTKVIYMSGYTGQDARVVGQGHGFVQKPFTGAQLVGAIRDVLSSRNDVRTV